MSHIDQPLTFVQSCDSHIINDIDLRGRIYVMLLHMLCGYKNQKMFKVSLVKSQTCTIILTYIHTHYYTHMLHYFLPSLTDVLLKYLI